IIAVLLLSILLGNTACAHDDGNPVHVVKVNQSSSNRGWLGVSIQDMTPSLASSMGIETEEGALVNEVIEESPAASAGILDEDVIVEFDGRNIYDADDLMRAVRRTKSGKEVDVVVMRKGDKKSLPVTVGKYPRKHKSYSYSFRTPKAPRVHGFGSHRMYGLRLSELNKQLGEYFGAPKGRGVLVEEVEEKSAADEAGFKAGDVVIKAGDKIVWDIEDIWDGLAEYDKGEKANIEILRGGSKKTLSLAVEGGGHYRFHFDCGSGCNWFRGQFFIPDDLERLEEEIRIQLEEIQPELKDLEIELNRIGKELKERLRELPEMIKIKTRTVHTISS
ncbi:MAG: PDZ domain-containing protein, partial [Ignavibacteria bacterium]|nr:PDZ domain-containing protein [Ignavibacteria bacterium]